MSDIRILEWFNKRKLNNLNDGSRKMLIAIHDAATEFGRAIGDVSKGSPKDAMNAIHRLKLTITESNHLQDMLLTQIARGELTMQERNVLMDFVTKSHAIGININEAAIMFSLIIETGAVIPDSIWKEIGAMSESLVTQMKHLISAVEAVNEGPEDCKAAVAKVLEFESKIDDQYFNCIKEVHLSEVNAKDALLADNMIGSVESASDYGMVSALAVNMFVASWGVR